MSLFNQEAIQEAQRDINTARENVQNAVIDELGAPLAIENVRWETFCETTEEVDVVNLDHVSPDIHGSNLLLKETISYRGENSRIVITNAHHVVPKLEGRSGIRIHTQTSRKVNDKGIIIDQWIGDLDNEDNDVSGLIVFIPFMVGKKVFGFYKKENTYMKFFSVGSCKPIEPIHTVTVPEDMVSVTENLTENNRVVIANASAKLRNLVDSWTTVADLHSFTNEQIFETIDPSYLTKLFNLSKSIIFPI